MTPDAVEDDMQDTKLTHVLWQGLLFFNPKLLELFDQMILMNWSCPLKDTNRLLLREWASKQIRQGDRTVIVCPSNSALNHIVYNASTKYSATGKGLEGWMAEKVFTQMANMVQDHQIVDDYVIICIVTAETGELLYREFSLHSFFPEMFTVQFFLWVSRDKV